MRLLWLFLGLALVFLMPFFLWGGRLEISPQVAAEWLQNYGGWAWAVGLLLLAGDLFLPIPATAVLAALGFLYGPVVGGLLGAVGSVTSGLLGYGLCRALGPTTAVRLIGERDLERGHVCLRVLVPGSSSCHAGCPCFPRSFPARRDLSGCGGPCLSLPSFADPYR